METPKPISELSPAEARARLDVLLPKDDEAANQRYHEAWQAVSNGSSTPEQYAFFAEAQQLIEQANRAYDKSAQTGTIIPQIGQLALL